MAKNWYVVHATTGCEAKVMKSIEDSLQKNGMEKSLGQMLIPTEDVIEIKKGKKKITPRKFFPGYILVEVDMTEDICYIIKNIPKVTGILGEHYKPSPLSKEEVESLLDRIKGGAQKPKPKFSFEKGEKINVIDGPFLNFIGVVEEVYPDRGKVKISVSIFGRATPLELDLVQIEKI